jgi:hypothetical protein
MVFAEKTISGPLTTLDLLPPIGSRPYAHALQMTVERVRSGPGLRGGPAPLGLLVLLKLP